MRTEHKSTDFCGARKFQREEQLRQFCKHVYHENQLVSASYYKVLWSILQVIFHSLQYELKYHLDNFII